MTQLLLLPGLACNAVMWQHQLSALPGHLNPLVTDVHTRFWLVKSTAGSKS